MYFILGANICIISEKFCTKNFLRNNNNKQITASRWRCTRRGRGGLCTTRAHAARATPASWERCRPQGARASCRCASMDQRCQLRACTGARTCTRRHCTACGYRTRNAWRQRGCGQSWCRSQKSCCRWWTPHAQSRQPRWRGRCPMHSRATPVFSSVQFSSWCKHTMRGFKW